MRQSHQDVGHHVHGTRHAHWRFAPVVELTDRLRRGGASVSRNIGHDLPMVKKSNASCRALIRTTGTRRSTGPVATIFRDVAFPSDSRCSRHPLRGALLGPGVLRASRIICSRWRTVNSELTRQATAVAAAKTGKMHRLQRFRPVGSRATRLAA